MQQDPDLEGLKGDPEFERLLLLLKDVRLTPPAPGLCSPTAGRA